MLSFVELLQLPTVSEVLLPLIVASERDRHDQPIGYKNIVKLAVTCKAFSEFLSTSYNLEWIAIMNVTFNLNIPRNASLSHDQTTVLEDLPGEFKAVKRIPPVIEGGVNVYRDFRKMVLGCLDTYAFQNCYRHLQEGWKIERCNTNVLLSAVCQGFLYVVRSACEKTSAFDMETKDNIWSTAIVNSRLEVTQILLEFYDIDQFRYCDGVIEYAKKEWGWESTASVFGTHPKPQLLI